MPLFDGLGTEEIQTGSVAGLPTQNAFFTGSVTSAGALETKGAFIAATTINAAGVTSSNGLTVSAGGASITGSVVQSSHHLYTAGSPFGQGWVTIPMTARSNISGGMWVTASGNLALAGPAAALTPLGVSVPGTNVASGGTVNVIIKGIVPLIAEGTVLQAGGVECGAGGALNTVKPHAAGSGATFATLDSAGSEGTVFVVL